MTTRTHPVGLSLAPARPKSAGLGRRMADWLALGRQRRALSQLDQHLLDDLGLSRRDALSEAGRRAWDVPDNWRR